MNRESTAKSEGHAVNQGQEEYKVGPGKPPKEYQWPPGHSGNPRGQPKHRTHLWTHYCKYMAMTAAQRARLKKDKLTAAQQTALMLVEKGVLGEDIGSERMARYVVDREEGKAVERLIIGAEDQLTDEQCAEIRELIAKNYGDSDRQSDSVRRQGDIDVQPPAGGQGVSPQPG